MLPVISSETIIDKPNVAKPKAARPRNCARAETWCIAQYNYPR